MKDRTTRLIASVALLVALFALILAGLAYSRATAREDELRDLSDTVRRALEARPHPFEGAGAPPPELDTED